MGQAEDITVQGYVRMAASGSNKSACIWLYCFGVCSKKLARFPLLGAAVNVASEFGGNPFDILEVFGLGITGVLRMTMQKLVYSVITTNTRHRRMNGTRKQGERSLLFRAKMMLSGIHGTRARN
jgi:hypothetical protein